MQPVEPSRAPAGFLRLYSDLESHSSMSMRSSMFDDQDSEESKESELEGVSVAFAFEDGGYTAEFPGEEAVDKEVLAGLEALLPWASLLPEEGVEVEAEWEIDAEAFAEFFDLGGDLAWDSEGNDDEDAQESEVEGTAIWNIEGGHLSSLELECEFTSIQEMIMVMEMGPETMEMEEISTSEGEATFSVKGTVERE